MCCVDNSSVKLDQSLFVSNNKKKVDGAGLWRKLRLSIHCPTNLKEPFGTDGVPLTSSKKVWGI